MIVNAAATGLKSDKQDKPLDLCCGNGALSILLFAAHYRYDAIPAHRQPARTAQKYSDPSFERSVS